jgi:hypothetical protein
MSVEDPTKVMSYGETSCTRVRCGLCIIHATPVDGHIACEHQPHSKVRMAYEPGSLQVTN